MTMVNCRLAPNGWPGAGCTSRLQRAFGHSLVVDDGVALVLAKGLYRGSASCIGRRMHGWL